jgi:hypothetical protein
MLSILISRYFIEIIFLNGVMIALLSQIALNLKCFKNLIARLLISSSTITSYFGLLILSSDFYYVMWVLTAGPIILGIPACVILHRKVKVNLSC